MEPSEKVFVKVEVKLEPEEGTSDPSATEEVQPSDLVFTDHPCIKVEAEFVEHVESETAAPCEKETVSLCENETASCKNGTAPVLQTTTEIKEGLQAKTRRCSSHSDEDKKRCRREQKKLSIRRARAKMTVEALDERRRRDREKYYDKKTKGLIKTIRDLLPGEQRKTREVWREKAARKREKEYNFKRVLKHRIKNR